jgi:hypothetical protein
MNPELQLRDIHLPPEPSWWPPAPGWWALAILLLIATLLLARWLVRRARARRRLAQLMAEFDGASALTDPAARLAAISQLLRRAARLRDPHTAQLQGEAWLCFLDGDRGADAGGQSFTSDTGRLLTEGLYRPVADPAAVEALIQPARRRFRSLVTAP